MRKIVQGLIVGLLLVAGGSLLPVWPDRTERPASDTQSAEAAGPKVVRADPVLTGSTLAGQRVSLPDNRPAVLFFFTVSCGTCFPGAQELIKARVKAMDEADYVAVNLDLREPEQVVKEFFTAAGDADFPVVTDLDMTMGTKFEIKALSTVVVIDAHGRETYRKVDPAANDILQAVRDASAD